MNKEWKDIYTFFEKLNRSENYVILRNYEHLIAEMTTDQHPDIDFLCEDAKSFCKCVASITRGKPWDKIHHKVLIGGKEVFIDIREVGDGYYDKKWEQNILNNRVLYKSLFYIPSLNDYFYSLLYHAQIQKKVIDSDYYEHLTNMRLQLNITDNISIRLLENYMTKNGYKYTYPINPKGVFNLNGVDTSLVERNVKRQLLRLPFFIISKVKERGSLWAS